MGKKTYFISDLHLGAACHRDRLAHERMLVEWLEKIAADADSLYLLGDVIDYWFEYREVVPRGQVRFLGQLARMADAGIKITWLKGNHDIWIYDYIPSELGITVVDGVLDTIIDGKRFVMEHGDGMGDKTIGFKIIRHLFRNKIVKCLFAAIHPRWTVAFAHRWSAHSRAGDPANSGTDNAIKALAKASLQYLSQHPGVDYFLYGHIHAAATLQLHPSGAIMMVLGDWIDKFTYATYSPDEGLNLHRYNCDRLAN